MERLHHVKTMCFTQVSSKVLKSEQTGIENRMYSTLATY